jgi:hypothetical protein
MQNLLTDRRQRSTWRHVVVQLAEAAADTADVSIAMGMALMLEQVGYRPV